MIDLVVFLGMPLMCITFGLKVSPVTTFMVGFMIDIFTCLCELLCVGGCIPCRLNSCLGGIMLPYIVIAILSFPVPCVFEKCAVSVVSAVFLLVLAIMIANVMVLLVNLSVGRGRFLVSGVGGIVGGGWCRGCCTHL